MQTQDTKAKLIDQIETFLTFTADSDDDTIVAQYTLMDNLIAQLQDSPAVESVERSAQEGPNEDYSYFLDLNTLNPQPIVRKAYALEGLQERCRRLLKQLTP
ncbi:hypothetical protein BH09BAC4_BH09BAC4_27310 [soil metagenome]